MIGDLRNWSHEPAPVGRGSTALARLVPKRSLPHAGCSDLRPGATGCTSTVTSTPSASRTACLAASNSLWRHALSCPRLEVEIGVLTDGS